MISFDLVARLLALGDTATWLDDADVHLFQNNLELTPTIVLADFIEADYTGYLAQDLDPTPIVYADAGNVVAQYPHLVFQPTGDAVANTVYGAWVEGTAGGVGIRLLWVYRFDSPAGMVDAESAVVVEPRLIFGQPTIE